MKVPIYIMVTLFCLVWGAFLFRVFVDIPAKSGSSVRNEVVTPTPVSDTEADPSEESPTPPGPAPQSATDGQTTIDTSGIDGLSLDLIGLSPELQKYKSCDQDSDCVWVSRDCCGCSSMGTNIAINAQYKNAYKEIAPCGGGCLTAVNDGHVSCDTSIAPVCQDQLCTYDRDAIIDRFRVASESAEDSRANYPRTSGTLYELGLEACDVFDFLALPEEVKREDIKSHCRDRFYQTAATKSKDPSLCDLIQDENNQARCLQSFISIFAQSNSCENFANPELVDKCRSSIIMSRIRDGEESDPEICRSLPSSDYLSSCVRHFVEKDQQLVYCETYFDTLEAQKKCFDAHRYKFKNVAEACEAMTSSGLKQYCVDYTYRQEALGTHVIKSDLTKAEICLKIQDEDMRWDCLQAFFLYGFNDETLCEHVSDAERKKKCRETAFSHQAKKQSDHTACLSIDEASEKRSKCITDVVGGSGAFELCEVYIQDVEQKKRCKGVGLKQRVDQMTARGGKFDLSQAQAYCEQIESFYHHVWCVERIATHTQDPTFCIQHINTELDPDRSSQQIDECIRDVVKSNRLSCEYCGMMNNSKSFTHQECMNACYDGPRDDSPVSASSSPKIPFRDSYMSQVIAGLFGFCSNDVCQAKVVASFDSEVICAEHYDVVSEQQKCQDWMSKVKTEFLKKNDGNSAYASCEAMTDEKERNRCYGKYIPMHGTPPDCQNFLSEEPLQDQCVYDLVRTKKLPCDTCELIHDKSSRGIAYHYCGKKCVDEVSVNTVYKPQPVEQAKPKYTFKECGTLHDEHDRELCYSLRIPSGGFMEDCHTYLKIDKYHDACVLNVANKGKLGCESCQLMRNKSSQEYHFCTQDCKQH